MVGEGIAFRAEELYTQEKAAWATERMRVEGDNAYLCLGLMDLN